MSLGPGSSLRKRFPKTFFSFYSSGKKHWVDKRSKRVDGGVIFLALPALERNAERKAEIIESQRRDTARHKENTQRNRTIMINRKRQIQMHIQ